MSQEIVPYDIFDIVDQPMKFIVYGDSVTENTQTSISINNIKTHATFDAVWNWLSMQTAIMIINNKEYIYIPNNINIEIQTYNEKMDQLEYKKPNYLMRHLINKLICRLNISTNHHLDVTNEHSLLHYNGKILITIKPKDAQYLPVIRNNFEIKNSMNELNYGYDPKNTDHKNKGIVSQFKYCKLFNIKPVQITSKKQLQYNGYVYDWSEPKNQNFIANGFLVHNTDSMYINIPTFKPKTTEEAIEKAEEMSTEINSIIIDFNKKFLMPKLGISEDQCYTNFDTEIVCDRFLLLDVKKRYAYRMIADKGKTLKNPKIKYVGIPVVRTDYAILTKTFIKRIVEGTAIEQIEKHQIIPKLNEIAKDIMSQVKTCVVEFEFGPIARPCKWSTNYKGDDPYQVIAMRLYNTIVDDNVFTPISSAQYVPIKITNPGNFDILISPFKNKHKNFLNNIPISKLNNLALPYGYDKNKVKTLMNKLSIVVDVNDVWSIIYNKDCQRIISAIKQSLG